MKSYEKEARSRWGNTDAYREHGEGTATFTSIAIAVYCKEVG